METPTPPENRRAVEALRQMIDPANPVIFRAKLEPGNQFYLVTVYYLNADISGLVSTATGFELHNGQFHASIKDIVDKLVVEGLEITNFRIVDMNDLAPE